MTTEQLAAALEALAGNLEGHLYQRERDLVSDAAQRLRELEGVRVAAVEHIEHGGHTAECRTAWAHYAAENGDTEFCVCGRHALRTALGRVGGGT